MSDYARIAAAIQYLQRQVTAQPSLAEVARHVHLSPFHFQRLFARWAGTTPKRFLQVLTLERGKQLLDQQHSVLAAADGVGLSSASRLHDHFVQIEAMTPGEYRGGGAGLRIRHGVAESRFGGLFVAATSRGICRAAFVEDEVDAQRELAALHAAWPGATLVPEQRVADDCAARIGRRAGAAPEHALSLHLRGTNFQLAVWRALLRIPEGRAVSYGALARHLGDPRASRAVGTAVGANPVAFLVPCHRVIQQSGALGGYRWGPARKQAMQLWEQLQVCD